MSGEKRQLICWDSCIFIAWLKGEQDKPLDLLANLLQSVKQEKTNLLVSAVSFAEVLDKAGESNAGTQFQGFVKQPSVIVANVDIRVGLLAKTIRETAISAVARQEIPKSVSIPDALIAATAVIYRAEELHTFDPVLISIDGWPVLRGLKIGRPENLGRTRLGF
jgi:predicted nucleic acid-binding protein